MPVPVVRRELFGKQRGYMIYCQHRVGICRTSPYPTGSNLNPNWCYNSMENDSWSTLLNQPAPVVCSDWRKCIIRFDSGADSADT